MKFAASLLALSLAAGAAAQEASPEAAASPELVLLPYAFVDENGQIRDESGDGSIWTTFPAHQHATLRVQLSSPEATLPAGPAGSILRRPGAHGVRIFVEAPEGVNVSPAEGFESWETDVNGVFALRVPVPATVGSYPFIFRTSDPEVRTRTLTLSVKSPNWVMWLALAMMGGLALLLTGMTLGSQGLQEAAGPRFREMLHTVTKKPFRGMLAGMAVTFFMQSSTATSVMIVGFVRAGLMTLRQSLGPIFGAAIGTTITVQLIAFNVQAYALPAMAIGYTISLLARRSPKAAAAGRVIFGFGMIFFGLAVMGEAVEPLKDSPAMRGLLQALTSRPVWCLLATAVFTALIHSSGATLGIAITLANQGLLTTAEALPIIFGANIGTTITAILAAVGGTTEGKRVAVAHLLFKIGAVVFFSFWFMPELLVWMAAGTSHAMARWFPSVAIFADTPARQIANADTIMCVISAVLALLFGRGPLEKTVCWLVPQADEEKKERPKFIDVAMLENPTLALGASVREISRMGRFVEEMVRRSQSALEQRDPEILSWLRRRDDKVDAAFSQINEYLTQLTAKQPSREETARAIGYLYVINDLESIGDLVVKMFVPIVDKVIEHDLHFSEEGLHDLHGLHATICDSLTKAMLGLTTPGESDLFEEVIARHEELQAHGRRLHLRHLKRLQEGVQETLETSSVHLDIVNYLLRLHYHVYSIAWTASRGVATHDEMV